MTRTTVMGAVTAVAFGAALLAVTPVALAHEDEQPSSGDEYIIEGDLVPEEAVPGHGPIEAAVFPVFAISPQQGSLCYDIRWDAMDPLTSLIIRLGYPEEFDAIEIELDPAPEDIFEGSGFVGGCIDSEPELLEFLAKEAESSHATVYSRDYPNGAAGGFLHVTDLPGLDEEEHEEDEPDSIAVSVLVAPLTPEHVVPDPPGIAGSGEARLDVTLYYDQICWQIDFDLDEDTTAMHLHVGGIGEVDPEGFRLDLVQEARQFGGTVESNYVEGCISVFHVVDFFALVENPEGHYVDVHTESHPEGALRGQLTLVDEFETEPFTDDHQEPEEETEPFTDDHQEPEEETEPFTDDHQEPEEEGRSLGSLVPHLIALLSLLGVTIFALYTFRRSRGLYDPPSPASVAAAAVSYAFLFVAAMLMVLDTVFAPESGLCSDFERFATLGLVLALAGVLIGAAAAVLAGGTPPLRSVAIALIVGGAVVMLAWFLWIPPQGCSSHGDIDEEGGTTITAPGDLACDETVSIHGDPAEGFEGYATPEEAIANSLVAGIGTHVPSDNGDWVIILDGRTIARVTVDTWQGDRYAVFDHEVCSDVAAEIGL